MIEQTIYPAARALARDTLRNEHSSAVACELALAILRGSMAHGDGELVRGWLASTADTAPRARIELPGVTDADRIGGGASLDVPPAHRSPVAYALVAIFTIAVGVMIL